MSEILKKELERAFYLEGKGGSYNRGVSLFYRRMFFSMLSLIGDESPGLLLQVLSDLEKEEKALKQTPSTSPGHLSVVQGFQGELDFFRQRFGKSE